MDQYMASVVKQLLGTETVKAMRARGITSPICGLSANDVEKAFLQAGANMFIMKPLPTDQKELTKTLFKILDAAGDDAVFRKPIPVSPSLPPLLAAADDNSLLIAPEKGDATDSLPKELKVLVCDDDVNLRQLLQRGLQRVGPAWDIATVDSGEQALSVAEKLDFDLIFLDQCMSSTAQNERPLLGTETVFAMRSKGVTSILCGCAGNDMTAAFLEAGANYFLLKPYRCEKEELTKQVVKMLGLESPLDDNNNNNSNTEKEETDKTALLSDLSSPSAATGVTQCGEDSLQQSQNTGAAANADLPETLSVLLAEDSPSLRKMFSRSLVRAAKEWSVDVVETGEAVLELIDALSDDERKSKYDLIFLDQHMGPGILGTDTAKSLRERGVEAIICGLSGDDVEARFVEAGANCFVIKPFPCKKEEMQRELKRVLQTKVQ